ncbi:MAG UNVERIFIED_CONTAM: tRNA uridine-5-carboxymethylaminomethyl(34) synthesis GTPase MnmE [Rickettsiaceae bacterium]|jgi:tRNA modification GTPase
MKDTIFAQSTARGRAGISVIRISGPDALSIAEKLTNLKCSTPNKLFLSKIIYKDNLIDNGMVVYFKAPNSFTGEDVVELHLHGSIAIIKLITESLLDCGIRIAEPGEFSRRAFLNGKMDLTSIEGLADLIDAETIAQHKHAMRHMSGEFEEVCNKWRGELLRILSLLEAYIDFPDEDIPDEVLSKVSNIIDNLKASLNSMLKDDRRGERLRNGLSMVVLGAPNVGKSTLLNYLAGRDVAITSDIAGTTRDIIETHIDIGGYPIILSDTAGLRSTIDIIEKEGIDRAKKVAANADLKLIMLDSQDINSISDHILDMIDDNSILIANKVDLGKSSIGKISGQEVIEISLKEKTGLDKLFEAIIDRAQDLAGIGENIVITRERHRRNLTMARDALEKCDLAGDLVLTAEDVRIAARYLSLMTGLIDTEEILGEIFKNFCIGK